MIFKPHSYQAFAIQRILDLLASGLLLGVGLGKTVCTLTAISELLHNRFEVARVLVIAPKRVAESVWDAEGQKWDHLQYLRFSKVLGSEQERIRALDTPADVYLINRENVEWLVDRYKKRWPFDMVVVDELSSFKSSKARRFRALRRVRPLIKRIVGLTATPAPNGLLDLWPQIYLLDRGERLGDVFGGYRSRFFDPAKWDRTNPKVIYSWEPKPEAEKNIHDKLSDLCVSMSAKDWLELPERINRTVIVKLSPDARAKYKQMERQLLLPFAEGDVVASNAAVLAGKLLQLANGAVYDEFGGVQEIHDGKLEALDDCIEAANGKPVLVFYSYKHDLSRLKARYPEARTLKSDVDIRDWNAGRITTLLAHPASAGHGLNLQAGGNIIVWFGLTWSLELYEQGNGRLDRQGQTESVIVHHLVVEDSIDEDVMARQVGKAVRQNALLAAVKARIKKLAG